MRKAKSLPYKEGTWFAVPLRTSGYAVGIVARMAGDGRTFGYFFGPKRATIPNLQDLEMLRVDDAVWIGRFGDLGILEGAWPVLGNLPDWHRDQWPLPPFIRVDAISGKAVKATYDDKLEFLGEEPCDARLTKRYPEDALSGYGAAEIWLTKLLDD